MRECQKSIIRVFTSCKSKTNPVNELNEALKKGASYEKIKSLLEDGVEIVNNATDTEGHRQYSGDTLYIALKHHASIEVIKLLLENGAETVNDQVYLTGNGNSYSYTLHQAIIYGASYDVVKLLLDNGADILKNASPREGVRQYKDETLAIALNKGASVEVIKLLLHHGANIVNDECYTDGLRFYRFDTLRLALKKASSYEIIKLLLENGAEVINDSMGLQINRERSYDSLYLSLKNYVSIKLIDLLLINGSDPAALPEDFTLKLVLTKRKDNIRKEYLNDASFMTSVLSQGLRCQQSVMSLLPDDLINDVLLSSITLHAGGVPKLVSQDEIAKAIKFGLDRFSYKAQEQQLNELLANKFSLPPCVIRGENSEFKYIGHSGSELAAKPLSELSKAELVDLKQAITNQAMLSRGLTSEVVAERPYSFVDRVAQEGLDNKKCNALGS